MRYAAHTVLLIVSGLVLGGVVATLGGCAGTDLDVCKGSGLCMAEDPKAEPAKAAEPKKDEAAEIEAKAKAEHAKKKAKIKKAPAEPPKQPLPNPTPAPKPAASTEDGPPVPLGYDR